MPVCMYIHVPCAPQMPEKGPGLTGTSVSDSCESLCGFGWELNLSSLESCEHSSPQSHFSKPPMTHTQ